jgi:hypothetical protein
MQLKVKVNNKGSKYKFRLRQAVNEDNVSLETLHFAQIPD